MRNKMWNKLLDPRILRRVYLERLGEPLIYNIVSVFVMLFGSVRQKIDYDCIPRNAYAYSILAAADHAKQHGIKRIAVVEFGVAAGAGLMNMCWIAEKVTRETGIEFDIIGFDSGEGMPPPRDFRDHPEKYFTGDFPIASRDKLLAALPSNAKLYYGPISETIKTAQAEITSAIGFVSIDVDYYWSTVECLEILKWEANRYLPSVVVYLDDVQNLDHNEFCGERAAVEDFNRQNDLRKITMMQFFSRLRIFKNAVWHQQMYYAHVFDHEFRSIAYVQAHRKSNEIIINPYLE